MDSGSQLVLVMIIDEKPLTEYQSISPGSCSLDSAILVRSDPRCISMCEV